MAGEVGNSGQRLEPVPDRPRRRGPTRRHSLKPIILDVERIVQPDDLTCGPTCLAQVYRYYGVDKSVEKVIQETRRNPDGGTLAVYLALSALEEGFASRIYSYNLRAFDPTWWGMDRAALTDALMRRSRVVRSDRLRRSLTAYMEYLDKGGEIRFQDLDRRLLMRHLAAGRPILTGLSATFLYRTPREYREEYDDIRGEPVGHFVVICGYDPRSDRFVLSDPSIHSPFSPTGKYPVKTDRLIQAILLGHLTYDAELLVLSPRGKRRPPVKQRPAGTGGHGPGGRPRGVKRRGSRAPSKVITR